MAESPIGRLDSKANGNSNRACKISPVGGDRGSEECICSTTEFLYRQGKFEITHNTNEQFD